MKKLLFYSMCLVSFSQNIFSKTTEVGIIFSRNLLETSQAYQDMLTQVQTCEQSLMKAAAELQKFADKEMATARQLLIKEGVTNEKDPKALTMQLSIEKKLRDLQDTKTMAEINLLSLKSELPVKFAQLQKEAANNVCKELKLGMIIDDSLVVGLGSPQHYLNMTKAVQEELDKLFTEKAEKHNILVAENNNSTENETIKAVTTKSKTNVATA